MPRTHVTRLIALIFWLGVQSVVAIGQERERPKLDVLRDAFATERFVAYTPSEYNPVGKVVPASPESIRADLQTLRPHFSVLVTYSVNAQHGLDKVVPLAADNGFRVVLGIWDIKSVPEISTAVELCRAHPKTILGIIIGNETMLRGGAIEDIETAVKLVRAALPDLPITTSEPISSYGNEALRALGDFHAPTVHWIFQGRDPANPEAAVAWLKERAEALREVRHGTKPLLVKEHGLPSAPEPFTEALQQKYWTLVTAAFPSSKDYALVFFEAFNLAWKTKTNPSEQGASEAHWGAWTQERKRKSVVNSLTSSAL